MELKPQRLHRKILSYLVLIVPYGIETNFRGWLSGNDGVLIVPYGIETMYRLGIEKTETVLIVPYGIETPFAFSAAVC